MTNGKPPEEKDGDNAGRDLRRLFLTTSAAQAGIEPTREFPRVYGVAMDWPIGEHIATIIALSDGSASVYTTGTFGIIGGIGHENVRRAARKLVRDADGFFSEATLTEDLSYPKMDRVRFFLVTYNGVRVIEADLATVTSERSKYWRLFGAAQDVLTQLRQAEERKSP